MTETSGLTDLLPFLGDRPALTLLAVQATVGQVTGALVDTHGPRVIEEASVREARGEPSFSENWVAVVRVRDESWTLVYRAFTPLDDLAWNDLLRDSVDLVHTLGTRAVVLSLSDAVGRSHGVVLRGGTDPTDDDADPFADAIEEHATWRDGVFEAFTSILREGFATAGQAVPDDFANRFLRDRGIWAAPCWPRPRGDQASLELAEVDPTRIERVDLLDLSALAAYDEETLELSRAGLAADLRAALHTDDDTAPPAAESEAESADEPEPEASDPVAEHYQEAPAAGDEAPTRPLSVSDLDDDEAGVESKLRGFFSRLVGRG